MVDEFILSPTSQMIYDLYQTDFKIEIEQFAKQHPEITDDIVVHFALHILTHELVLISPMYIKLLLFKKHRKGILYYRTFQFIIEIGEEIYSHFNFDAQDIEKIKKYVNYG